MLARLGRKQFVHFKYDFFLPWHHFVTIFNILNENSLIRANNFQIRRLRQLTFFDFELLIKILTIDGHHVHLVQIKAI